MPLTRISMLTKRGKKRKRKEKESEREEKLGSLSCYFHSLPHLELSFSFHTQLLPSQPDPSIVIRLILFVPFKTLYDYGVGASNVPPPRGSFCSHSVR